MPQQRQRRHQRRKQRQKQRPKRQQVPRRPPLPPVALPLPHLPRNNAEVSMTLMAVAEHVAEERSSAGRRHVWPTTRPWLTMAFACEKCAVGKECVSAASQQ